MTDQSTQVNFPVLSTDEKRRRMRRYNTSAELSVQGLMKSNKLRSAPSLPRPRSLNFAATDSSRQQKLNCSCQMSSPVNEYFLAPPYQNQRVSPYSTVSSGNASTLKTYSAKLRHHQETEDCVSTASRCRFCDVESGCRKTIDTPEGLSWRRLHMSRAKLKATATTSELLSGFAMIAMVELQINEPTNVPEWLFVVFAVSTTVLVTVHIFALMISTYILPNVDAVAKMDSCEMVDESPHERMRGFIEIAWAFSTVLGLFLFLVEVAILCWVKFWDYSMTAAVAATIIMIPVLVVFVVFACHFYHSMLVYRCDASTSDMEKLENMKKQLDEVAVR